MAGKFGPTGEISWSAFRDLIEFDEERNFGVRSQYYGGYPTFTVIHTHYFKDGVEVGYWTPITHLGYIFETPRVWCPKLKAQLT